MKRCIIRHGLVSLGSGLKVTTNCSFFSFYVGFGAIRGGGHGLLQLMGGTVGVLRSHNRQEMEPHVQFSELSPISTRSLFKLQRWV